MTRRSFFPTRALWTRLLCSGFALFALSLHAAEPPGYYNSAAGLTGTALRNALHNIIDDHEVTSYADARFALEELDEMIVPLVYALRPDDLLLITADHGCDPTDVSTDHTREYVPLIIAGTAVEPGDLGERATFADLGATVAEHLGLDTRKLEAKSALEQALKHA